MRSVVVVLVVVLCGAVSCSTCPDGVRCNDRQTCCFTERGYRCCQYPNAVCCADQAHCCPFGFTCDSTSQMCVRRWGSGPQALNQPRWVMKTPLQEAPPSEDQAPPSEDQALPSEDHALPSEDQAPPSEDQALPSVVYCDNVYTCPDGFTCCRHPGGGYTCCPYSPARCCLDGYHCCPYGYDCDYTYTHCIRQSVPYPFSLRHPSTRPADRADVQAQPAAQTRSLGAEPAAEVGGLIRCSADFYCPKGTSCCQNQSKEYTCCPYPLGICCNDGQHCCEYGYTCDPTSTVCRAKTRYP